jgi:16S rRNA processing protein RimM
VKGEVSLEIRTDWPAGRLVAGASFATDRAGLGRLTLLGVRHEAKVWLARFAGVGDRSAAEELRGVGLLAEEAAEPDAWYPHELRGLNVVLPDGRAAGRIRGVVHGPVQDLLEVDEPSGRTALIPFVEALVPVVDVAGGRIVVDPPAGLLAAFPDDAGSPAAVEPAIGSRQDDGEESG